jgi:hypothetical protein
VGDFGKSRVADQARPGEYLRRWGFQRPRSVGFVERWAEARLAGRLGWRRDLFEGRVAIDNSGGSGAFRVRSAATHFFRRSTSIAFVRLANWLRFGNAFRQLTNLFFAAESYGVRTVEFRSRHPLFQASRLGPFTLRWQRPTLHLGGVGLEGDFFYLDALGLKPTIDDEAKIAKAYLRDLLSPSLRTPTPRVGENDLVLHFRAGDVFGPGFIHPLYGQPPLAYYLAAVERERPARAWLVYESRANPCVNAVEARLRAAGVPVEIQSGTLEQDLSVLLSARRLVAGRGSFCDAVAALSERLERLYLFGTTNTVLRKLGIGIVRADDVPGDYTSFVLSGNWAASPRQLLMMLQYDKAHLRFDEEPPLD